LFEFDRRAAFLNAHDHSFGDQIQVHLFMQQNGPGDKQFDALPFADRLLDGEEGSAAADVHDPAPSTGSSGVAAHGQHHGEAHVLTALLSRLTAGRETFRRPSSAWRIGRTRHVR
jgi:hypothetical protein